MTELWEFLLRHGHGLLFVAVLVEHLGAPLPAVPLLLVMGALAGLGYYSFSAALPLSVAACLGADYAWFVLGRQRGDSILAFLCKLSLEPDTCVRRTSRTFERWGPATLLIAKFVPGLSTVAPPLAGSAGLSSWRFILFDAAGSALWAGAALSAGYLPRREVERVFEWLPQLGSRLLILLLSALVVWIIWKLWQRSRAMRLYRIARISPAELHARHVSGEETYVVDLRAPHAIARDAARIPGARLLAPHQLDEHLRDLPRGAHLVFYCT
jgi:membrane protein DedA with SNARE-associated domain